MAEIQYFDNERFNNIDSGGFDKSVVKGQFQTGCADPYMFRYNGVYYLYVTTSGLSNYGLRAWKSIDLLSWEPCQGKGLPLGYVVDDHDEDGRYTQNAYAPEVYYFNGKFYMIISPGPAAVSPFRGHRILVADSPEGPFHAYSEQLDKRIDGTLLIDDDEEIYFAHATPFGITIHPIENMKDLGEGALIKASDGTGAWTEGPGLTKVRGYYYLTYTGCHYQTPGYQVLYAYADHLDKTNIQTIADSFKVGASRIVLLNCDKDEGHVGLGHSINFLGPDLDSYYICYHNLDALYDDGMTHRSFNIDRLLVGNGLMTSVHNKRGSVYPKFPFFSSYGREHFAFEDGRLLSTLPSKKRFSAEMNSRGGDDVRYLFSYENPSNYAYVHIDYDKKSIKVYLVKNGVEVEIGQGKTKYQHSITDNQTIRIAYDGTLNVYFNNLLKISVRVDLPAGRIGYQYKNEDIEIGYSAISTEANGSSDKHELKQALGETPAFDYQEDEPRELYDLKGLESEYAYTKGLMLRKGEHVSYPLLFKENAHYGIVVNLEERFANREIEITLNGEKRVAQIPLKQIKKGAIRSVLVDFGEVKAGIHRLEFKATKEEFGFVSFYFAPVDNHFEYENDLSEHMEGIHPITDGLQIEQGQLVMKGRRNFAYISSQLLTDCFAEADIMLESVTEEKGSIGLLIRQNNYAYSDVPNQDFKDANTHIQAYYLEIKPDRVNLSKFNFGDVKSFVLAHKEFSHSLLGENHHYKFIAEGGELLVYMDEQLLLEASDPHAFHVGAVGLYGYRSEGAFKNLKIQTINKQ